MAALILGNVPLRLHILNARRFRLTLFYISIIMEE
jgi:hypothetical protein